MRQLHRYLYGRLRREAARKRRRHEATRRLQVECLESRRLLTLPATLTTASSQLVAFNGPTVDTVQGELGSTLFVARFSFYFAPQFTGNYVIDAIDLDVAIDPEVAVYRASDGARVGYNDDVSEISDNARLTIFLTGNVRYIISAADKPDTATGRISMRVTAPGRSTDTTLAPDVFGDITTTVDINTPADIDYFTFTTPPDATGKLIVREYLSPVRGFYSLFSAAGERLIQFNAFRDTSVEPNTTYRLAVSSDDHATSGQVRFTLDIEERGAIVTNTLDAGPGSLRNAMLDANSHASTFVPAKIVFEIPNAGPYIITPLTPLPPILYQTVIDGMNNSGSFRGMVSLDGSILTGLADGLQIRADESSVSQLNIRNFPGDGIDIQANRVSLQRNYIGTSENGTQAFGNGGYGIFIQGTSDNKILQNLISGNGLGGIAVAGETADNNLMSKNTIGLQLTGNLPLPNQGNGISITDGDTNTIDQNVISSNSKAGVVVTGTAVTNSIVGNRIGTDAAGLVAIGNTGDGIVIRSPRNKIGGNLSAQRNLVSGNGQSGLVLTGSGASNNVVEGNYIGTNLSGNAAIPNALDGIRVVNAGRNRLGSTTDAKAGNLISGNRGAGISLSQAGVSGSLIYGNLIGTTLSGLSALGNAGPGVLLFSSATNVQIGGTNATSRNLIAANGAAGISLTATANNNRISRNLIGLNLNGSALGNASAGIQLQGSNNTIGGPNATYTNTIGGSSHGILVTGASATNNAIAFNNIGTTTAPNTLRGITFSGGASNSIVGPKNKITGNTTGLRVEENSLGIRITENSFAQNVGFGIDLLGQPGVTVNDAGDADTGANRLQNYPIIIGSPLQVGSNLEVSFRVNTSPLHAAYPLTIEIFAGDGSGEGSKFLGSTLYTEAEFAVGVKSISIGIAGAGLTPGVTQIVATATDFAGNSSEFSPPSRLAAGALRMASTVANSAQLNEAQLNQSQATTATPGPRSVFDINGDNRLNELDALILLNTINDSARTSSPTTSGLATHMDVDSDGKLSLNDALLVIRGIQIAKLNTQSVAAINQQTPTHLWDTGLIDLLAQDLLDVKRVLKAWL